MYSGTSTVSFSFTLTMIFVLNQFLSYLYFCGYSIANYSDTRASPYFAPIE